MPYSPWIEDCRQTLESHSDDPNDKLASSMVKLQILVERIHQSPWHNKSEALGLSIPTMFMVGSFQESLRQFKQTLPPEQENNGVFDLVTIFRGTLFLIHNPILAFLNMHYHVAEALVYEVGFSKSYVTTQSNGPDLQRLECLCSCLHAIKAFFDIFLATPRLDYFSFSVPSVR